MPLTQNDIKVFKSTNISDSSLNGGDLSNLELADVVGALFANVDNTERTNGSTKWRKVFFKLHNDGLLPLVSARLYQDQDTQGTDTILMTPATAFTDVVTDLPVTPNLYGSLNLRYSISSGATSLDVLLPAGISNFFANGQSLRISNKNLDTGVGSEDFVVITNVVDTLGEVSITFTPAVSVNYLAEDTRVANILEFGDLVANADSLAVTSAAGGFDLTKVQVNNRSTVNAVWTLTFTSSINFNITSTIGVSATGNLNTEVSITNPAYTLPYFVIPTDAYTGNFVAGNTITFATNPAALPVWLKRIVPAGATPLAGNRATFVLDGGTV